MYNNDTYVVWGMDATSIAELAQWDYPSGNINNDRDLCIANHHDNIQRSQTIVPSKPSYVTQPMPNFPYLSHPEARQLVKYLEWNTSIAITFASNNNSSTAFSLTYTGRGDVTWTSISSTDGTQVKTGTSITFPEWVTTENHVVAVRCAEPDKITAIGTFASKGIVGTPNLLACTSLSGDLLFYSNSGLLDMVFPNTPQSFDLVYFHLTGIGSLDFSTMPNMTSVNNCAIRLNNCGMSATEVNTNLDGIDSITIDGGYTGRTLLIHDSNAAPTADPPDGIAAEVSLEVKNMVVTVSA